jgi:Mn-dependent DtxR family transcriptional regulator
MSLQVITTDDLIHFKNEIISDIKTIFENHRSDPNKKWVKTNELKKILKVSDGTLQNLRIKGTLKYTRLGGIILYDLEHIQKKLDENLSD